MNLSMSFIGLKFHHTEKILGIRSESFLKPRTMIICFLEADLWLEIVTTFLYAYLFDDFLRSVSDLQITIPCLVLSYSFANCYAFSCYEH